MKSRRSRNTDDIVVGVDAGGSSTRAVVVGADGDVRGRAFGAAGNPTSSGVEAAAANVVGTVGAALDEAGGPAPARIAVAMAGASIARAGWLSSAFAAASIRGTVAIEADLAATYLSGSRAPLGYAVIAGTGAIAARLVDHRIEAVSDGLGWLVGDDGSGFWIGRRVLRAVASALDGRGPGTSMTDVVLASLSPAAGVAVEVGRTTALDALVASAYGDLPVRLARYAPLAFRAAEDGDSVARQIVAEAAERLAATLGAVLADGVPGAEGPDAPVVLGGGVLAGQPRMAESVRAELLRRGRGGAVIAVPDGTVGAALLALEGAGHPVDDAVAERIRSGL